MSVDSPLNLPAIAFSRHDPYPNMADVLKIVYRGKCEATMNKSSLDIHGGKLKDYGFDSKPYKRKFDNKKLKRQVTIKINAFFGEYHHYYVEIKEEENPIWIEPSEKNPNGAWLYAHDDSQCNGKKFYERFVKLESAKEYANLIIKDHFDKKTHTFLEEKENWKTKKWYYREGD